MELVASVRRYSGRNDTTRWLSDLPTRYTPRQLRDVLSSRNKGKLLLWSLEEIYDRKSIETLVKKGVTIL